MATFELWNMTSGNLLGTFATEAEALAAVQEAVARNGNDYGSTLALGRENSRGKSKIIASGPELIERAVNARSAPSYQSPRGKTRIA